MVKARKKQLLAGLLIFIALLALTIVGWRRHQVTAHILSAIQAADGAKLAVLEAATVQGALSQVKASDVGYNTQSAASPYVTTVTIADGGAITLTTRRTGTQPDPILLFTPLQIFSTDSPTMVQWSCKVIRGDPNRLAKMCVHGMHGDTNEINKQN